MVHTGVRLFSGAGCDVDRVVACDVSIDPAAKYADGKEHGGNSSPSYGSGRGPERASCGGEVGFMIACGKSGVLAVKRLNGVGSGVYEDSGSCKVIACDTLDFTSM